ncbi:MAG TPA: hypothetical protein VEU96_09435 [Bryobacteraceae bacterium]|nr:hypothetical protein [Bryobacteraceae bacterium]
MHSVADQSEARAPHRIFADFFEEAQELRADFDKHFSDPYSHDRNTQIWDYWHVPDIYAYLRTNPEKVLNPLRVDRFFTKLSTFSAHSLGLLPTRPVLSLYINGCQQALHNDATNGRWAYVFSLTRWHERRFTGGETIIFREKNYWETVDITKAGGERCFLELIPACFNQLLLFDDRLVHGVKQVQGTMVPQEGRIVMHGHLEEAGMVIQGPLDENHAKEILSFAGAEMWLTQYRGTHDGLVTLQINVHENGQVDRVTILVQRILKLRPDVQDPACIVNDLVDSASNLHFSEASTPSVIIAPFTVPRM